MLINLTPNALVPELEAELKRLGVWSSRLLDSSGNVRSISLAPHSAAVAPETLAKLPGVSQVLASDSPHPLVDEHAGQAVRVGEVSFGEAAPVLVAGPCALDSESAVHGIAAMVAAAGGKMLRGGAFKPRSSPYAFAGHGRPALIWLAEAAHASGLMSVSEVMSEIEVEAVAKHVDMVQVGSRNMQNFALLRAVGCLKMPVLLKRGRAATVEEWLLAAEYLYASGASGVVFCERGVRGFDPQTRNLLDLGAVALLRHAYALPVVVDPSHAVGRRDLILPLARASIGAGACGLMVEVNPDPELASSDAPQAIGEALLAELGAVIRTSL
jgi:3-deoxy-7-phosphoheptulonate synthase